MSQVLKARIIKLLLESKTGKTADALARQLDVSKSTVERILYRNTTLFEAKNLVWYLKSDPTEDTDPFREYLERGSGAWRTRALTASSYRNVDRSLTDEETNKELATYGDAVLKLALCELLLDRVDGLSVEKARYENDRVLVRVIARHYDILRYLRYDTRNDHIPDDYDLVKREDDDNYKYIATAVEALLGAYYKEYRDYDAILKIVSRFKELIDQNG